LSGGRRANVGREKEKPNAVKKSREFKKNDRTRNQKRKNLPWCAEQKKGKGQSGTETANGRRPSRGGNWNCAEERGKNLNLPLTQKGVKGAWRGRGQGVGVVVTGKGDRGGEQSNVGAKKLRSTVPKVPTTHKGEEGLSSVVPRGAPRVQGHGASGEK